MTDSNETKTAPGLRTLRPRLAEPLAMARAAEPGEAMRMLLQIGDAAYHSGDRDLGWQLINEVDEGLPSLGDLNRATMLGADLARIYAKIGETDMALETALALPEKSEFDNPRGHTLLKLVMISAWAGHFASAEIAISNLLQSFESGDGKADLAIAQARNGNYTEVSSTIASIRRGRWASQQRRSAWEYAARWLAYRGERTAALAMAAKIADRSERSLPLADMAICACERVPPLPIPAHVEIGEVLVERDGREDDARHYLAAARKVSPKPESSPPVLLKMALAASRLGELENASAIAARLRDSYLAEQIPQIFFEMARAKAEAGDFVGALHLARSMQKGDWRSAAFGAIAATQASAGDEAGALTSARAIRSPKYRIGALIEVGRCAVVAGRRESAKLLLRQIIAATLKREQARKATPALWTSDAFDDIVIEQAAIGDFVERRGRH